MNLVVAKRVADQSKEWRPGNKVSKPQQYQVFYNGHCSQPR